MGGGSWERLRAPDLNGSLVDGDEVEVPREQNQEGGSERYTDHSADHLREQRTMQQGTTP